MFATNFLLLKLAASPHSHRQPHTRAAVIVSAGAVSLLTESSFSRASICTLLLYITESFPVSISFFRFCNPWLHLIVSTFNPVWVYFKNTLQKFLSFCSNHGFRAGHGRISDLQKESSCLFANVWVSGKIKTGQFHNKNCPSFYDFMIT